MILFADINENKKTIVITEKQSRLLKEAADADFNTDNLVMSPQFNDIDSIKREFKRMKAYCKQHLGPVVGMGSSRIVYQIDDNRVLKLAGNRKGIAQNKAEAECYEKSNSELFPKIYNKAADGMWIDCEFVLPAEEKDFEECTDFTWEQMEHILDLMMDFDHLSGNSYQYLKDVVEIDPFIREIYDYVIVNNNPAGDLMRTCNWGMTKRNGVARMVILDSGFTWNVLKDFYQNSNYNSYNSVN